MNMRQPTGGNSRRTPPAITTPREGRAGKGDKNL
jgi:hypothetical protein